MVAMGAPPTGDPPRPVPTEQRGAEHHRSGLDRNVRGPILLLGAGLGIVGLALEHAPEPISAVGHRRPGAAVWQAIE